MDRERTTSKESVSDRIDSLLKQTRRQFLGTTSIGILSAIGVGSIASNDRKEPNKEMPPTKKRVETLFERMSLEEKAAQLGSVQASQLIEDGELDHEAAESHSLTPTSDQRWGINIGEEWE